MPPGFKLKKKNDTEVKEDSKKENAPEKISVGRREAPGSFSVRDMLSRSKPDLTVEKQTKIDNIPRLVSTIEELLKSLESLNAEFLLSSEEFGEIWLTPYYTGKERREISFQDAVSIVVLCSAFNAKVESLSFDFERVGAEVEKKSNSNISRKSLLKLAEKVIEREEG